MTDRSINPDDYQELPAPVAVMQKRFPSYYFIDPHSHRRDQLIFAATGTMRVRTTTHSWIVPPERAVYMPGGVEHSVAMHDDVEMRTLYIEPDSHHDLPDTCIVITPSGLLREMIGALLHEPNDYERNSRGEWLSKLILDEICQSKSLSLSIPMPADPRLQRVCELILDNPQDDRSLDGHAERSGASARTIARLSQRELGMSLSSWRQQVRFHYALEALARGSPVGTVAQHCGYSSVSAFTAAFRKSFGQPPSRILDRLSASRP
jgi:AraC-like DNA-binding protein